MKRATEGEMMAEKIEGEGGEGGGRPAVRGTRLPCVLDGLPPGPMDMAALYERMERDTEARVLACLGRALARRCRSADSDSRGEDRHGKA